MSESVEMSPELALRLLEEGSTCVCLGVSKGTEIGIDVKSWTSGDKFLGIKMIPPGFHYIHYSMTNSHGDLAPRAGFTWTSAKSEIIVKKWNESAGVFEDGSAETADRIKANLKDIDKNLGAYPYEIWEKWKALTSKITENLAKKIVPNSGIISSVLNLSGASDLDRKSEDSKSSGPKKRQRRSAPFSDIEAYGDLLPSLHASSDDVLHFSTFPENCYPPGSTPSEITQHSLDSTYLLKQILTQHDRPEDVLGELQFAFVSFLVGHSMEGFEQWKRLVGVFCSVQSGLLRLTPIFSDLLTILQWQLEEIPQDFLVDIVSSSNFVYQSLRKLFRNIAGESPDGRLKSKACRLQELLTEKFLWDFSDIHDDEEDEQPVIVET